MLNKSVRSHLSLIVRLIRLFSYQMMLCLENDEEGDISECDESFYSYVRSVSSMRRFTINIFGKITNFTWIPINTEIYCIVYLCLLCITMFRWNVSILQVNIILQGFFWTLTDSMTCSVHVLFRIGPKLRLNKRFVFYWVDTWITWYIIIHPCLYIKETCAFSNKVVNVVIIIGTLPLIFVTFVFQSWFWKKSSGWMLAIIHEE